MIETERLVGERPARKHQDALALVVQDPRVIAWLWPDAQAPRPEQLLARFSQALGRPSVGPWIFRERASGDPIGYGGPQRTVVEGRARSSCSTPS